MTQDKELKIKNLFTSFSILNSHYYLANPHLSIYQKHPEQSMETFLQTLRQMIRISDEEILIFIQKCERRQYVRKAFLSEPGKVPHEVFFILSGLLRVMVTDREGNEHTVHFALENQFIADYSAFIQGRPAYYALQALEPLEVLVLPRAAIEWGYQHLAEGEKLGRLIAEYYFIYQDHRLQNQYVRNPKERYDSIGEVFPNIHNRVPQHMIASYLGITPEFLSKIRKDLSKK